MCPFMCNMTNIKHRSSIYRLLRLIGFTENYAPNYRFWLTVLSIPVITQCLSCLYTTKTNISVFGYTTATIGQKRTKGNWSGNTCMSLMNKLLYLCGILMRLWIMQYFALIFCNFKPHRQYLNTFFILKTIKI